MRRPSTRMGLILAGVADRRSWRSRRRRPRARRRTPAAPIVIGWAFDSKGAMAPFDNPALAAAQLRVKAGEREGRRQRPQAPDQDVRHAGQQAGDREGVRAEAARRRRERHLHDVRRRLRRAGRAGGDQPRRARGRTVHRHRPDGPEAVRREGQARVQLRQRRAGRGLGDGRSTRGARAGGRRRSRPTRSSSTSRTSSRRSRRASSSSAARSSRTRSYQSLGGNNVQNAVSRLNDEKADVIVTSTAGAFGALSTLISGLRSARQRHAGAQLVGRRRQLLAAEEPEGDELLVRHVRLGVRRRPVDGRQQAREAGQGGHRRLPHRPGRDRRRRHRDPARRRLDERRGARGEDGEVQEGADDLRAS